ncbi:hypothetical protein ACF0H5_001589 [Mactra antiquata]
MDNVGEYVTKGKFAGVFKNAWEKSTTIEIAVKGFRDGGLFPLDPRKVLGTLKMEPSRIFSPAQSKSDNHAEVQPSTAEAQTVKIADRADPSCHTEADTNATRELPASVTANVSAASKETVSTSEGQMSACNSVSQTPVSASIGTAFTDILKIPTVQTNTKPVKVKRLELPKAISGNKFHQILLERKRNQEEELKAKEQRKQEREARKLKKQEEQLQKKKIQQEKKEQREAKRKQKEVQQNIKAMQKSNKRKFQEDSDSDSSAEPQFNDDELDDIDVNISKEQCYACEKKFTGDSSNWIMCHNCPRWLHRSCVSTIDLLSMSESEIADLQFECDFC